MAGKDEGVYSICFLDLDDTLIPTSWMRQRFLKRVRTYPDGSARATDMDMSEIYGEIKQIVDNLTNGQMEEEICRLLTCVGTCTDHAVIVTNARSYGWVRLFQKLFPKVSATMSKYNIQIVKTLQKKNSLVFPQSPGYSQSPAQSPAQIRSQEDEISTFISSAASALRGTTTPLRNIGNELLGRSPDRSENRRSDNGGSLGDNALDEIDGDEPDGVREPERYFNYWMNAKFMEFNKILLSHMEAFSTDARKSALTRTNSEDLRPGLKTQEIWKTGLDAWEKDLWEMCGRDQPQRDEGFRATWRDDDWKFNGDETWKPFSLRNDVAGSRLVAQPHRAVASKRSTPPIASSPPPSVVSAKAVTSDGLMTTSSSTTASSSGSQVASPAIAPSPKLSGSKKRVKFELYCIGDNEFEFIAFNKLVLQYPHHIKLAKMIKCIQGLHPIPFLAQLQHITVALGGKIPMPMDKSPPTEGPQKMISIHVWKPSAWTLFKQKLFHSTSFTPISPPALPNTPSATTPSTVEE